MIKRFISFLKNKFSCSQVSYLMFLTADWRIPSVSMTTTAPDSGWTRARALVTSSCTATTSENSPPNAASLIDHRFAV